MDSNFCNFSVAVQPGHIVVHGSLRVLPGRHGCRSVSLPAAVLLGGCMDVILFVSKRLLLMGPDSSAVADSIGSVVLYFGVGEQVAFVVVLKVVAVHIVVVTGPHYQMDFLMRVVLDCELRILWLEKIY